MESQETDAPGLSVMSKKGPPLNEQEKKKTTVKVSSCQSFYLLPQTAATRQFIHQNH